MAHMNSSENKNISVSEDQEESGWTAYFEDLSCCKEESSSFITLSPSLVSDAAWNGSDHIHINRVKMLSFNNNLKKINNKKYPKNDDDLEDTASSPVNSPKVSSLKHMEVNHRRTHHDVYVGNFLGKQGLFNNNFSKTSWRC